MSNSNPDNPTPLDRILANVCRMCPACRHARKTQSGLAYALVNKVESHVCPFCRAYERITGHKAHEPLKGS